jgi:hypothetical protein
MQCKYIFKSILASFADKAGQLFNVYDNMKSRTKLNESYIMVENDEPVAFYHFIGSAAYSERLGPLQIVGEFQQTFLTAHLIAEGENH